MTKLPVVLFAFRRPDLTARVFDKIRDYRPEKLILIADGPRSDRPGEVELAEKTRSVLTLVDWPCEVIRNYASTNLGLRERILTGLDFAFERVEEAIILEDDCLPSSSFFEFMEAMITRYKSDPRVGLISGSNFAPYRSLESDYHFSAAPYIWGWATWARTWKQFRESPQVEEWSPNEQLEILKGFSSQSQGRTFVAMMKEAHRLNTWDISLAVWFRQNQKLAIVPRQNLVRNLGFGADATHTKFEAFDVDVPAGELPPILKHPSNVAADNRRERIMWRSKQFRWVTFPLRHPIDFTKRFVRYLKAR